MTNQETNNLNNFHSSLNEFVGTEQYYFSQPFKNVHYTEGVKYFIDNAGNGANWFLIIVATEIIPILKDDFFFIELTVKSKLIDAEISKEELIIEQPAIEKQEVKKEKTKQPENYVQNRKRPIFKDNYERYEWHMKNGCIGNEDRQWLSEYIRSEEFKIIYEK